MNIGHQQKAAKAYKLSDLWTRAAILSLMGKDDPSERPQPKQPVIEFQRRRLPGEERWPRERLPQRVGE